MLPSIGSFPVDESRALSHWEFTPLPPAFDRVFVSQSQRMSPTPPLLLKDSEILGALSLIVSLIFRSHV
jgi:hypothetical protein